MKKTLKKGFTIVELVIVIAVVAILAAVLIPTFVSVTKKANESKDTQLVRNLNTALAVDTEVGKHTTMQSALEAAEKAGYDVAKINTSATDNEILWDSVNDCFVYKKDDSIEYIPNSVTEAQKSSVKPYQYWVISGEPSEEYSTYLYNSTTDTFTVKTGLDVGNETVTSVNYTNDNGQEVTIRTNGGALEINAKDGSVNHYGNASVVTINEVAKNSYHEYGTIGEIKLAKGRVVVEKEASVGSVFVTATSIDDIKVENNGTVGGVAAKDNSVAGSLKNNVDGVNEDKIITSKVDNSEFAGGLGTESAPYLIETSTHFMQIKGGVYSKKQHAYYKLINDIDMSNETTTDKLMNNNTYLKEYLGSIDFINFDGCGKKVILGTDCSVADSIANSIIKNCEFVFSSSVSNDQTISQYISKTVFENIITSGKLSMNGNGGIFGIQVKNNITLNNCVNNADIVSGGDYDAVFLGRTYIQNGDYIFTFNNCVNKGNMTASRASFFLANSSESKTLKLIINNCKNEGTIRGTATTGLNGQDKYTQNQYITMPGSNNYEIVVDGNKINSISEGFMMGFVQGPNDTKLSITENEDKTFTITESDNTEVAYYIIKIGLYMVGEGMSSGTELYYLEERITDNNSGSYVSSLKHYDFAKVHDQMGEDVCGYKTAIVGGNLYYYLENVKGTGGASLTLKADTQMVTQIILQAYLADGTLVSSTTL